MDLGHGQIRMDVEVDRLSSLSDDLIHKILSFISIRHAVETSVLSSRWRFIWTTMPYLNFQDFDTSHHFSKFVSNFFSRHNDQTQVYSLKLLLPGLSIFHAKSVERVVSYAFSHNVKELTASFYANSIMITKPTTDLPALTTLHLDGIILCDDDNTDDKCIGLLSKCPNLKNLSLEYFKVKGTNVLNIRHPRLSDLTLMEIDSGVEVVAPQLKNLTIMDSYGKHLISAPGLTSLVIRNDLPLHISIEGFPCLEKADLYISPSGLVDAHEIVCLLQQLHNLKFLTLNLEILELLSSSMEWISHQPSPFANFKITSVSTSDLDVCLEARAQEKEATSTETENYLLDTSSCSIFTMVSCEEIRVMREIKSARRLMESLREGAGSGLGRYLHEHGKSQVMNQRAHSMLELQSLCGELMAQIRLRKTKLLILSDNWLQELSSLLQHIEGLVTELPASKRDVMQATFSSLCEDAAVLINNILGLYKDSWDEGMQLISYVKALKLNL